LSGSEYMLQLIKKLKLFFESASDSVNSKLNLEQIHGTECDVHPSGRNAMQVSLTE